MKILVIQLARLGDIYLSWPALRAMKRSNPGLQITLLTRAKFAAAAQGLNVLDEVIELPTAEILSSVIDDNCDVKTAHAKLLNFVREVRAKGFDRIINLSFSPASSYLTHLLEKDYEKVTGYSRTEDGFLAIPDDMSAYFYAQVGAGHPNRFHLSEIFGTLCGVDLEDIDWTAPDVALFAVPLRGPFVVIHVGASEAQKAISAQKWISILSHFRNLNSTPVVLIGSENEISIAETILSSSPTGQVVSLVGKTTLQETMSVLKQAKMLVGADSAPLHMASLTRTKTLNLSVGSVNFWETGPRAAGSWVLRANQEVDLVSDRVARAMTAMIEGVRPEIGLIQAQKSTPSFSGLFPKDVEFQWKLTQAIYQGTAFPLPTTPAFWEALTQLVSINQFLLEQLDDLQKGASLESRAALIERGEEVIQAVAKLVPSWSPVIRWYHTEKVRIGPGTPDVVLKRTHEIQLLFQQVLELYQEMQNVHAGATSEAP